MAEKDLTIAQRSTLLTLMVKAGPLPNMFFRDTAKISLDKTKREALEKLGLITVTGKPMVLELTEKGWGRAIEELTAAAPPRAGALGGVLYLLLNYLHEFFERKNVSAAEFFTATAPADRAAPDLETRIRKAYAELAPRAGDYLMLDTLRRALGGAARADVDAALLRLDSEPDVHLVPESNQKVLTDAQRAAAISIGNQDMHLIAIGV